MIANAHRFHGRNSLRFVYQKGSVVRCPEFALRFIRNARNDTYRVAVVVSRKVSKSAVVRNRIRRRMYEIVRQHAEGIQAPYDLVFIIYADAPARLPHATLDQAVVRALQKAGALPGQPAQNRSDRAIVEPKETTA